MNNLKIQLLKLIRWSEKYTKTDMLYVIRGGFWITLFQITTAITGLLVTVVLTNVLPKELFGQYKYVLAIQSVLAIFNLPGIGESVIRKVSVDGHVNLFDLIKTKIKWAFVGGLISILISIYYIINGNSTLSILFLIVAITLPFFESFTLYISFHKGRKDFKTYSRYMALTNIFQAVAVVIVALTTKNIFLIMATLLISQSLLGLLFFRMTVKNNPEQVDSKIIDHDTRQFGKQLSLFQVLNRVVSQMDKLLIWHYFNAVALATYTVALVIPQAVARSTNFVPQIALPKFSTKDWTQNNHKVNFYKKTLVYCLFLIFITVIYCVLLPIFYKVFFPQYMDAVKMGIILGSLILLTPIYNLLHQVLISTKHVTGIFYYRLFEFCAYILIFYILMFVYGKIIYVLIIALPVRYALTIILQIYLIHKWKK